MLGQNHHEKSLKCLRRKRKSGDDSKDSNEFLIDLPRYSTITEVIFKTKNGIGGGLPFVGFFSTPNANATYGVYNDLRVDVINDINLRIPEGGVILCYVENKHARECVVFYK